MERLNVYPKSGQKLMIKQGKNFVDVQVDEVSIGGFSYWRLDNNLETGNVKGYEFGRGRIYKIYS